MCAEVEGLEMKKKLSLGLVAVACVALLASGAMGASVFFSPVGEVGGGVAPCPSCLSTGPGHTETLYIWSTDDQDYDTRIGMNVVSSDPVAVALVAADIANPDITSLTVGATLDVRWHDVAVGDVTPGLISNMNGIALGTGIPGANSGTGILGANDGTVAPFRNLDTLYSVEAGAFLLGSVTMTTSPILGGRRHSSVLSINQEGTAGFVNDGVQVFPNFIPFTVYWVTPEPSTLLLAIAALAVVGG
jgi:hypothetical protein